MNATNLNNDNGISINLAIVGSKGSGKSGKKNCFKYDVRLKNLILHKIGSLYNSFIIRLFLLNFTDHFFNFQKQSI